MELRNGPHPRPAPGQALRKPPPGPRCARPEDRLRGCLEGRTTLIQAIFDFLTTSDADGVRASFAEAHRRYTGAINARFRWRGHLFPGRFGAVVMDEPYLLAAARYIALNRHFSRIIG